MQTLNIYPQAYDDALPVSHMLQIFFQQLQVECSRNAQVGQPEAGVLDMMLIQQ